MENLGKRIILLIAGLVIISLNIGMLIFLDFGIDPLGALMMGISNVSGLPFGTLMMLGQILFFVPVFCKRRDLIGVGTVVSLFGLGYLIQFFVWMWGSIIQNELTLITRVALLVITLLILSFGVALQIVGNLGLGTYDALAFIIATETKDKINFKWARIGTDALSTAIGFLLGATIGVATVVTVFMLGPFVNFFKEIIFRVVNVEYERK